MLPNMRQQLRVVGLLHQHPVHLVGDGGLLDPGPEFGQIVEGEIVAVEGQVDVFRGQFPVHPVHQFSHAAGVDEERLAAAVAKSAFEVGFLVAGEEPEAHRDLGGVEELARQGDDAVHQVVLDNPLPDGQLRGGGGGHGAVGHDEAGDAVGPQVVDEVLDPGVVGVVRRRHAVFPAHVLFEALAAPIGHVEGRIGEDGVGLQILVQIVVEAVGLVGAEVGVDAADGEVHPGQLPGGGGGLLAIDGDIAQPAAVFLDELLALHEHATGTAAVMLPRLTLPLQIESHLRVESRVFIVWSGSRSCARRMA